MNDCIGAADRQHALYPGSFDVLTNGHLEVLSKAVRIFPRVTIAIACNSNKANPLFTFAEREAMLREATASMGVDVEVASFTGLTVDFARAIGAGVIVRGLRVMSDFEAELQMAMANEQMASDISTVFLASSPQHVFLSSSMVKELARHGGDLSAYVLPCIAKKLRKRLGLNG